MVDDPQDLAADAKRPERPRYWWFGPESVARLREQLNAVGDDVERLMAIPYAKDGQLALKFRVIPTAEASARVAPMPDVNDSWQCPPIC
jgi:hypothetical protein